MVSVIKIAGDIVYLGYADGHMEKVSISAFDKTPIVGNKYEVYKSDDGEIVLVPLKKNLNMNNTVQNVAQNVGGGLDSALSIFRGRMTRGDYIIRMITCIVLIVIIGLISDEFRHSWRYKWVSDVCGIAMLGVCIWWLSCFVRRLHDIGFSALPIIGTFVIIGLFLFIICAAFKVYVRVAGPLVVLPILIGFKDSQPCDNKYGQYKDS